ncbi:MAG TPA: alpha/beta hydrolase [Planctomycetaceae bacterium]|nr:alpha/beta hydrolase [Planctomycetaceae bacterium]
MVTSQPIAPATDAVAPRSIWRRVSYVGLRLLVPIPKGKGFRSKLGWVGRRIVYWYLIILVMLAFFQRYLIYQPTRADVINPELSGLEPGRVEAVSVPTADGLQLNGWLVRALPLSRDANHNGSTSHPVVLYFPGNAGHRGYRAIELDQLSRLGADAYLVDYRGYGDNPGKPTEENLAADAQTVWKFVTTTRQVKPSQVVLLGESLGGGVATRLASELSVAGTPPGGLILRSTFSSLVDAASYHYPWLPVGMFLLDRFPSAERIAKVTCPVLVLHGNVDTIVPFESGKRLFDAAPAVSAGSVAKQFVVLPGAGHNDIQYAAREPYRAAVKQFLDRMQLSQRPVESAAGH